MGGGGDYITVCMHFSLIFNFFLERVSLFIPFSTFLGGFVSLPFRIGADGTHVVGFLSKGLFLKLNALVMFPGCGTGPTAN